MFMSWEESHKSWSLLAECWLMADQPKVSTSWKLDCNASTHGRSSHQTCYRYRSYPKQPVDLCWLVVSGSDGFYVWWPLFSGASVSPPRNCGPANIRTSSNVPKLQATCLLKLRPAPTHELSWPGNHDIAALPENLTGQAHVFPPSVPQACQFFSCRSWASNDFFFQTWFVIGFSICHVKSQTKG